MDSENTDGTNAGKVPRPIAWMDGRVVPASEATVPLLDDGFLRGDAVFDAILIRGGRTHALDGHLARLRTSGHRLGIRIPVLRQVVADLLAAWGDRDGALKLVVTRRGTVRGLAYGVSWPESMGLHVVEVPWRTAIAGAKTVSYAANQWALREAQREHADDALIVSDGEIMELPTAAICLVGDGRISSPDPERSPILDSVTVRVLQQIVEVERRTLTLDDLQAADEVFVLSATRPILPVHSVDDLEFPSPGPRTAEVQARLREHIEGTLDPLP